METELDLDLLRVFEKEPGSLELYLTLEQRLRVDKATRARRVRQRSYEKFGERMGPGGDLFQQEEDFFAFTAQREDSEVEAWLATLHCPVVEVDGTLPIQENVEQLAGRFSRP